MAVTIGINRVSVLQQSIVWKREKDFKEWLPSTATSLISL